MVNPIQQRTQGWGRTVDRAYMDEALRSYMLRVYNLMASGLALSGIVAVALAMNPTVMQAIFGSGLGMVAMFAPLGLLLVLSFGINRLSAGTVNVLYWSFVALQGVSLSAIFLIYDLGSITRVFFITAGMFGAMSLYGYTTKRDLSGWGSFFFMAVIGLVIASVVNLFLGSEPMAMAISAITVLVFTGLTAYDTQMIKSDFYESDPSDIQTKKAVMGATMLYVNFLNIFLALLRLFGNRE